MTRDTDTNEYKEILAEINSDRNRKRLRYRKSQKEAVQTKER